MNLKKLPPSMLMALGLGCVADACLSPPIEPTESSTSGPNTNTVGPCLSPPLETTAGESSTSMGSGTGGDTTEGTTFGPCLSPEPTGTTGSGSDSGTGSDSGSGSGSESGSTGMMSPCLAPPGIAPDADLDPDPRMGSPAEGPASDRQAVVDRVLDRDLLPADVADRLRTILGRDR